jgi:phage shock protein C
MTNKTLTRSATNKMVAGVLGGFAEYFNWDATLLRVLFVASFLMPGPQLLLYIAAWIIMPEQEYM